MESKLRRLQFEQLEILKKIDAFCRKYNIQYSLYAGTLLGAVRHQGAIPWDDDLDICMSRSEYCRFIEIWTEHNPEGYVLQNKDNTSQFPQSFTKIRKDHTTFLQSAEEVGKYHTGIFVDIFPIDRIPKGRFAQLVFRWNCVRYQLYTREFVPPKGSGIQKLISRGLLYLTKHTDRQKLRQKLLDKITRYADDVSLPTIAIETFGTLKSLYPADLMEEFVEIPYEGKNFLCMKQWDCYLQGKYGDYMQLPPEDERMWKHHPIIIDFEHNYEELEQR